MTLRHYLQLKTRTPAFLWRMVIGILAVGIVGGFLVEGRFRSPPNLAEMLRPFVDAPDPLQRLAEDGKWLELWWTIPEVAYLQRLSAGPVALAIFSGCWWLAFCMQAAHVPRRSEPGRPAPGAHNPQLWLLPLAVLLGALSIWPTHFLSLWIEVRWNIEPSAELAKGLRYFILGVGVPEELAKLLCFLPLVPILLRIRSDLTALIAAGCVGLGFAVVENMGYFHGSRGGDVVGRFLTANPFHMTLTGVAGLALYRAARDPRGWGPQAVAMVGLMIFAHGLYDATIVIPELVDVAILGSIIFALVVYQFFREMRDLRTPRSETISLTATFLAGVSTVTAATFIYVSGLLDFQQACDVMAMNVLSLSLMAYLFLREMPETMVTV